MKRNSNPSKSVPRKVVIYIRISVARDNQTSTKTQEAECRKYATQQGWEVVDVFTDDGISAWNNTNRPGLQKAVTAVEIGRANTLLVWKLDRFARSMIDFHSLLGRIVDAKGFFVSVTDPDFDGPLSGIMMALIAGFAEMESNIKSERAGVWQQDRIATGAPNGGARVFGYQKQQNSTLPIDEEEANVLRTAAKMILDGVSLRKTLKVLNPMSATGKGPMTARGLRSALTNPTVAGLRRNGNDYAQGNWTAILPRDQWDALNTLFSDPSRRTATSKELSHLLSGIAECGKCGKSMGIRKWKANPTKRQPYVQEAHRVTCLCGNSIDEGNAINVVMTRLWQTVTPSVWESWKSVGTGWDPAIEKAFADDREMVIMNQLARKIAWDVAESMLAQIDRDEAIARGEEPMDLPDVDDVRASWSTLTVVDQQKVIRQAFKAVTIKPSNGTHDPFERINCDA